MKRMEATPWIDNVNCNGKRCIIDLELEKFNTDKREKVRVTPKYKNEYVEFVKDYFHTDDPNKLVERAWRSRTLPVWCEDSQEIQIVDSDSGKMVKKVASQIFIAEKIVTSMIDTSHYPESLRVGNMNFERGMAMMGEVKYIFQDDNRIIMVILKQKNWQVQYVIPHGLGWAKVKEIEFSYVFPHDLENELKRIARLTGTWIKSTESRLNVEEEHRNLHEQTVQYILKSLA